MPTLRTTRPLPPTTTTTTGMEYELWTLATVFAPAAQELHPEKCEVMSTDDIASDPPRLWADRQREIPLATQTQPRHDTTVGKPMKVVESTVVLGARIDMTRTQDCAEGPRQQEARGEIRGPSSAIAGRAHAFSCPSAFARQRHSPSLLWSLGSQPLLAIRRRSLNAIQRNVVGRTLLVLKRFE